MHAFLLYSLIGLTGLAALTIVVFRKVWTGDSRLRSVVRDITLSLFVLGYTVCAVEAIFANFMIRSDGFGFTLSSKKWFERYWNPINADGYRDYEHEWKDKVVFITGDSFAAGHGLNHIEDRFSTILNTKLGEGWTVAVIAQNGWGPKEELDALNAQQIDPDILIVSYYPNDILAAGLDSGIISPGESLEPDTAFYRYLVARSYLINFVYWQRARAGRISNFWEELEQAFADEATWKAHQTELEGFAQYAEEHGTRLCFVLWPLLIDIEKTDPMLARVRAWLDDRGIAYLDLSDPLRGRPVNDLIANPMDGHPNAAVHPEVGEWIFESLGPWEATQDATSRK